MRPPPGPPRIATLWVALLCVTPLPGGADTNLPLPPPPTTRARTSSTRNRSPRAPEPAPVAPVAPSPAPAPAPSGATASAPSARAPDLTPSRSTVAPVSEKPRLVVLELVPAGGVESSVASVLTEGVTQEAAARGFFQVISSHEIQTMLGHERERQMTGCSGEASSCLAELAGAIGARFVLSGSLARLGSAYQLNLQTLDTVKAVPLGRSTRIASDLATLRAQLSWAVAEATATPLPPPPSRVLPYAVMSTGALVFLGGGLAFFDAVTRDAAVARELANGEVTPAGLQPLSTYAAQRTGVIQEKTIGLAVAAGGAALIGLGLWLNPPDTGQAPAAHATLLPTSSGVALVGVMP